ncbi:AraC family transcriptional regulator [Streptomyces sp. A7024]|uniref:AraC family transcriptional regulator n=1 Tax=Streptomyces coryli TaxID=1128680 RepID=A0A6G4TW11_9ACTN|nr:helix-turn-helix domain-containing protein [Streptomyces coryli]NGN63710.1 AraC family transcriptional regulator [Streptomyces coryli]
MGGGGGERGRGVLHPEEQENYATLHRYEPGPAAAPFVEYYWHVTWQVPGTGPYEAKVLSHPNVHLVFEEPGPLVYGVDRGLFVRELYGRGQVLGVRFRPGGFRGFAGGPVAELADRRVPAAEFFGPEVEDVSRAVLGAGSGTGSGAGSGADSGAGGGAAMVAIAEEFLVPRLPDAPDPQAVRIAAAVERVTAQPQLFRVDQLAAEFGVTVRTLQRLFAEYVGASPKWVLRRARLHEAATRADAGGTVDWAGLAADLGYADQAHFVRDFTGAVGASPGRYTGTGRDTG